MGKIVLYIATTLDGKIARNDGSLDWLYAIPNPNEIDHGYSKFYSTIGATVMGRKTYDEILGFGVEWPYTEIESYVVTTDESFNPDTPNTAVITSNIVEQLQQLAQKSEKDVWVIGGGKLITYLLNYDLIDSMILTIVPILLGAGIALFPNEPTESNWTLLNAETFETGVINLTYEKRK